MKLHPIVRQATYSFLIAMGVFGITAVYTSIRHQAFDLFILNKIFAGVSGILLGIVVVTGVFGRLYAFFDRMLLYRKWLGIASFFFAYLHGMITLFFLPDRFPASRFHLGNTAFVFALISLLSLCVLFVYSFDRIISSMNRHTWWNIQKWGVRIAFAAGILHAVLVKYPFWLRWFEGKESSFFGQKMPPAGLFITIGMVYVVFVRIAEFTGKAYSKQMISGISVLFGLLLFYIVIRGVFLLHFYPLIID